MSLFFCSVHQLGCVCLLECENVSLCSCGLDVHVCLLQCVLLPVFLWFFERMCVELQGVFLSVFLRVVDCVFVLDRECFFGSGCMCRVCVAVSVSISVFLWVWCCVLCCG